MSPWRSSLASTVAALLLTAVPFATAGPDDVRATAGSKILVTWTCEGGCQAPDLAGFRLALYARSPGGTWQKRVGAVLGNPAARSYTSPDMAAWLHAGDSWRIYVAAVDNAHNQSAPASSPIGTWQ